MTGLPHHAPSLVGDSAPMDAVRTAIRAAARIDSTVLLLGETGVGKEVVARRIHAESHRAAGPFVPVNSAGIPDELLESELFGHARGSFTGADRDTLGLVHRAHGGTLFLDEVGEMSSRLQAALLRFTETGEIQRIGAEARTYVDVRLVTATHRDLHAQVVAGQFREDLFYRLNVIQIALPPLRERGADIVLLFEHYLEQAAGQYGLRAPALAPEGARSLLAYFWPGNVRELRNLAERVVVQGRPGPLGAADIPFETNPDRSFVADATPAVEENPESHRPGWADDASAERVQHLWIRLQSGEDFWTVVGRPFKSREITRGDLAALIDRGLRETHGSYRALLPVFHLDDTEYKRFHAFLYQQRCNLPVAEYRTERPAARRSKVVRRLKGV